MSGSIGNTSNRSPKSLGKPETLLTISMSSASSLLLPGRLATDRALVRMSSRRRRTVFHAAQRRPLINKSIAAVEFPFLPAWLRWDKDHSRAHRKNVKNARKSKKQRPGLVVGFATKLFDNRSFRLSQKLNSRPIKRRHSKPQNLDGAGSEVLVLSSFVISAFTIELLKLSVVRKSVPQSGQRPHQSHPRQARSRLGRGHGRAACRHGRSPSPGSPSGLERHGPKKKGQHLFESFVLGRRSYLEVRVLVKHTPVSSDVRRLVTLLLAHSRNTACAQTRTSRSDELSQATNQLQLRPRALQLQLAEELVILTLGFSCRSTRTRRKSSPR
ncbi:hypothetical protein KC330_g20 [Hortaea werneckii]|nr:hypothetical protein KC330_g20 [Hortaea werneckii]